MTLLDEIGVAFHFGGGVCLKEHKISAGLQLSQHVHKFDHLSYLVSGKAVVDGPFERQMVVGPAAMLIEAGKPHSVRSVSDCVWLCIHASDKIDPDEAEKEFIA